MSCRSQSIIYFGTNFPEEGGTERKDLIFKIYFLSFVGCKNIVFFNYSFEMAKIISFR